MADTGLTADQLRAILSYSQDTGEFRWLHDRTTSVHAGDVAGCFTLGGYRQIRFGGVSYKAHRLAWLYVHGAWPTHVIDHINGVRTDNRIANLRDVPHTVNKQNQRRPHCSNRSSGLLGVAINPSSGKFQARIHSNGRNVFLGEFTDPAKAHSAYVDAKRSLHQGCTI